MNMNKNVIAVLAVTMALLATAATRHRATLPPGSTLPLSLTRSFAVTDIEILRGFPFARVVDAIAARSGVAGATGGQLIRQLYDTQNPRPGMADTLPDGDPPDPLRDADAALVPAYRAFAVRYRQRTSACGALKRTNPLPCGSMR